jgi:ABC-type glycerol-3-phosphate transport system substrate-binding protein
MLKRSMVGLAVPLLTLALVLVGLMMVAYTSARAGEQTVRENEQGDPVSILFWHSHTSSREVVMQRMVDEFNAANAWGITVQAEYAGNYGQIYDRVIQGLRSGGPLPNAVIGYPNQWSEYARYGAVRFLDRYLSDPVLGITDTEDFYPDMWETYRLKDQGGQLAGLQHGRSIDVMYYNQDLLTASGLPVPETWGAFESACISVTNGAVSGTIPGTDASRFATWLWSRGGEVLSEDNDRARFHEQPGIDSLLLFQELIQGGYGRLPRFAYDDQTAFCNGQAGFVFGSSAGIPYYHSGMEAGAQDAWGVARVPAIPGHEVVDSYGAGIGVLQASEAEDQAAWLFIRWLAGRDQTARWAAESGYYPVRISAVSHPSLTTKLAEDAQYAQGHALLPLGRTEPAVRGYEEARRAIGSAMSAILGGGDNVTGTLQGAAVEVEAILAGASADSAVVGPAGGRLVYSNTQGLSATVGFPPAAVEVTQTVAYVPLNDLPTDGLAFALVPNLTFSEHVTITLHYRDSDVEGMDENELKLYQYDWSLGTWVDADPCDGYSRDTTNNVLQAFVCHFSDYALDDRPYAIHLPSVLRDHTS